MLEILLEGSYLSSEKKDKKLLEFKYYQNKSLISNFDLSSGKNYKSHYWKGFGNPKNYFFKKKLRQKIISNFDPMLAELVTI